MEKNFNVENFTDKNEQKNRLILLKMPEEVYEQVAAVLKKNGLPVPKTDFNVYKWVNVEKFMQRLSEQMFIKAMIVGSRRCGITFSNNTLRVNNEIGELFLSRLEKESFYNERENDVIDAQRREPTKEEHPSYFDRQEEFFDDKPEPTPF